jgi:hypothetical protein
MKTFIISFILSLFIIVIYAFNHEDGDLNATGMYLLVFSFPSLLFTILNAAIINFALMRVQPKPQKIGLFIFPISVFGLLCLSEGATQFLGVVGVITLGIVNSFWISSVIRLK